MVYSLRNTGGKTSRKKCQSLKKKKKYDVLCVICCNIGNSEEVLDEGQRAFIGKENDCFGILLKWFNISADPFLRFTNDWSENDFTFCRECNEKVKKGFLLTEEIKNLEHQLEKLKDDVITLLRGATEIHAANAKARKMIYQCYQKCTVSVNEDLRQAADNAKRIYLHGDLDVAEVTLEEFEEVGFDEFEIKVEPCDGEYEEETDFLEHVTEVSTSQEDTLLESFTHKHDPVEDNESCHMENKIFCPTEDKILCPTEDKILCPTEDKIFCPTEDKLFCLMQNDDPVEDTASNEEVVATNDNDLAESLVEDAAEGGSSQDDCPLDITQTAVTTIQPHKSKASEPEPLRRSTRKRKLVVYDEDVSAKSTGEVHKCSACGEGFSEARFLAKHYWASHSTQDRKRTKSSEGACDEGQFDGDQDSDWESEEEDASTDGSDSDVIEFNANMSADNREKSKKTSNWKVPSYKHFQMFRKWNEENYGDSDPNSMCFPRFKCHCCSAECTLDDYDDHVKIVHALVHDKGLFGCQRCGDVNDNFSSSSLSNFKKIHETCELVDNILRCKKCDEEAGSWKAKMQHYRLNHLSHYRCGVCDMWFISLSTLLQHQKRTEETFQTCGNGGAAANNSEVPKMTSFLAYKNENFQKSCELCGILCNNPRNMARHLRHHKFNHSEGFIMCNNCGGNEFRDLRFNMLDFFEKHASCTPVRDAKRKCLECSKVFEEVNIKLNHVKNQHYYLQSFKCEFCPSLLNSASLLREHERTVHLRMEQPLGDTERSIQDNSCWWKSCPFCDTEFTSMLSLVQHNQEVHNFSYAARCFICTSCGAVHDTLQAADGRKFLEHADCRPVVGGASKCHVCMMDFTNLGTKAIHFRNNHTNFTFPFLNPESEEDPFMCSTDEFNVNFVCGICDIEYPTSEVVTYTDHMRLYHNMIHVERKLACRTCGDIFLEAPGFDMKDFKGNHLNCSTRSSDFPCKECGGTFRSVIALLTHFIGDHFQEPPKYNCGFCGWPQNCYGKLKQHLIFTHKKYVPSFYSYCCKGRNTTATDSSVNPSCSVRTKKRNSREKCRICNRMFPNKYIKSHALNIHGLKLYAGVFACWKCKVLCEYDTTDSLQQFQLDHGKLCQLITNESYACPKCTTTMDSLKNLMHHYRSSHLQNSFDCSLCDSKYFSANHLSEHLKNAHRKNAKNYSTSNVEAKTLAEAAADGSVRFKKSTVQVPCLLCDKSFSKVGVLVHYKSVHKLLYSRDFFACPGCHEILELPTAEGLANFVELHADCPSGADPKEVVKLNCRLCNKSDSIHLILQHYRREHDMYLHQCAICGKKFKSLQTFNNHESQHNPEKFKCKVCFKQFYSHNYFVQHLKSHLGLKPEKEICDICGKIVIYGSLMRHRRLHGELIRDVKCTMCDKMFWNKLNMQSHIREFHLKKRKGRVHKRKSSNDMNQQNRASTDTDAGPIPEPESIVTIDSAQLLECFKTNFDAESCIVRL